MKKILLIVTALVLMVSGVAAVSAYEAHLINVKAHVENALTVGTAEVDFGTVFPQEWIKYHRSISLSTSAIAEKGTAVGDLQNVVYQIYAEWKPVGQNNPVNWVEDAAGNKYYQWMGYFLYVGIDATQVPNPTSGMTLVGPPPLVGPPGAKPVLAIGTLDGIISQQLAIAVDVPVFEGYYNALTDMLLADGTYAPKPSGLADPTWIIPKTFPGYNPLGMDFGLDLKVQVTDINRVQPVTGG
jgi:hypothetical protein